MKSIVYISPFNLRFGTGCENTVYGFGDGEAESGGGVVSAACICGNKTLSSWNAPQIQPACGVRRRARRIRRRRYVLRISQNALIV